MKNGTSLRASDNRRFSMRLGRTAMWLAILAAVVCVGCTPSESVPGTPGVAQPPEAPQNVERETAGVGVGRKREDLGPGFITTPINVYLGIRERLAFEAQIPKQMQLYKAMHEGKAPADMEEYMNEIIKPCGIELPELRRGHRYVYDAEAGQLMVERPR